MLKSARRYLSMVKIAGLCPALVVIGGLSYAQEEAQKPSTPAAQSEHASTASSPRSPLVMAVAVQSWHGVLVDGNCTGGAGASQGNESTADQKPSVDTGRPHRGHKNRSAETQSCPVSSSTGVFALKTDSGQLMKFDMVGNTRTAETLKTKPAWTKNLSENKPIKAKVSGILNGDTITVTDIG
jgi:hypothetical protein